MKKLLTLVYITLTMLTTNSPANAKNEDVAQLCADSYIEPEHQKTTGTLQNLYWIIGFMHGIKSATKDKFNIFSNLNETKTYEWIHEYCRINPKKSLSDATEAFYYDYRHQHAVR